MKKIDKVFKTIDELKAIATAITNNKDIQIKITDYETSFTDFKTIYISINNLPNFDIKFIETPFYKTLLNGLVSHEGGHYKITKPLQRFYINFYDRKGDNFFLAKTIINIIEDKRVNYFISKRYRLDLGKNLDFTIKEIGKSIIESLNQQKDLNLTERIINYIILKGLYDIEYNEIIKDYENEQIKKDINDILKKLDEVKNYYVYTKILDICEYIFNILEKYYTEKRIRKIPIFQGGEIKPILDNNQKKQIEKEIKEIQKQKAKQKQKLKGAGNGLGLEIETPIPDKEEYQKLYNEVKKEINELLNYLKKTQNVDFLKEDYQKHGRLMYKIIPKVYTNSLNKIIQNIYTNNIIRPKEEKAYFGIIVDISGSMNPIEAKKSLIVFGEVLNSWLNNSEFCILAYGSNFVKLKTFYEDYNNVKNRIGGLESLGGTVPIPPLKKMIELMKNLKGRKKYIVIVSDFEFNVNDYKPIEKIIKGNKDITFINICYNKSYEDRAKQLNNNTITIDSIRDLPKKFFEIYRNLF
jgi:hypothetical protein